jgi:translocation and assembly module TamA
VAGQEKTPVNKRGIVLALACCALAFCAPARAQAEGEVKYRVEIEAPKELREMLEKGLQLERWQTDALMTPELLRRLADEAVAEATEAAAAQGYYSARVSYALDRDSTPWRILLQVDPGERTAVSAVEIAFTGPATGDAEAAALLERVRREWLLRAGMPFTQEAWEEAKRDAARKLSSWRYAAARIAASRADVDPEARTARLSVTLDSGPPFRFGAIEVRGTRRYPDQVVENLNPARAGDTYDREALALYVQRLMATGYFASARADVAPDPAQADAAPVRATVIEGSTRQIETGLSFNTDVGPRLELNYRDVDLNDSAWRWRNVLRVDRETQEARTDFDTPPRTGGGWINTYGRAKHTIVQNEENTILSTGLSYNWPGTGSPSAVVVTATFEEQKLPDTAPDHRSAVFFGVRHGFRRTDDLILPRRGYFGNLTAGGAPSALATQQFARFTGAVTLLFPLGRNDDLVLRGEGGVVVAPTREGIPSDFLFRTGGDQTIRGYAFESLGVKRGDAVIGGRYLLIGSAEVTHWMSENWGIAASPTPATRGTTTSTSRCSASAPARASARRSARCASTSPTARRPRTGGCTFPSASCSKPHEVAPAPRRRPRRRVPRRRGLAPRHDERPALGARLRPARAGGRSAARRPGARDLRRARCLGRPRRCAQRVAPGEFAGPAHRHGVDQLPAH